MPRDSSLEYSCAALLLPGASFHDVTKQMPKPPVPEVKGWTLQEIERHCGSYFRSEEKYLMVLKDPSQLVIASEWVQMFARLLLWERYRLNSDKEKERVLRFQLAAMKLQSFEAAFKRVRC